MNAPRRSLLICVVAVVACGGTTPGAARPAAHLHSLETSPPVAVSPAPTPAAPAVTNAMSVLTIQRLDARTGFLGGATRTGAGLAETNDGGATWRRIPIPGSRVTALRFIDRRVGWAAAFVNPNGPVGACPEVTGAGGEPCRGVVLRTEDAGRSWQETLSAMQDSTYDPVRQLQAVDDERAWALTVAALPCPRADASRSYNICPTELHRTTDGGRTWTTVLQDSIAAVRFADAYRGWVAIQDATGVQVRVTSDGGTTWENAFETTSGIVIGLDAATRQAAWLMTRDSTSCTSSSCSTFELFRTRDGGRHWSSLGNPKAAGGSCSIGHLGEPLFASTRRGWLTLNLGAGGADAPGGLLTTEDGGVTWRCATSPPNTWLVSAADPLRAWVVNESRPSGHPAVYRTENGGRTWCPLDLNALL